MTASIITIGDEILIGQIVDTNSAWIAQQLGSLGIAIRCMMSIADTENEIEATLRSAIEQSQVVIVTGGLGPTNDDRTKQVLLRLFGGTMVSHGATLEHIRKLFAQRGKPLTESNRRQADVPSSCQVLFNVSGTAPGMMFERDGHMLIALPGVPFEMQHIMETSALERLAQFAHTDTLYIRHAVLHTFGIAESHLSERLQAFERSLPSNIGLAYLPSPAGIRLRLSGSGGQRDTLEQQLAQAMQMLEQEVGDYAFGHGETSLPLEVGKLLQQRGQTLATAESCTGGKVSHLITSIPGSSAYFKGGVVAYSNAIKQSVLGVSPNALECYGAVSQEVVEQMAEGARRLLGTDYAIATSGIAGPDGGTDTKPIGLIYAAVSSEHQTVIERFQFGNLRHVNMERAAYSAINMLLAMLRKKGR